MLCTHKYSIHYKVLVVIYKKRMPDNVCRAKKKINDWTLDLLICDNWRSHLYYNPYSAHEFKYTMPPSYTSVDKLSCKSFI